MRGRRPRIVKRPAVSSEHRWAVQEPPIITRGLRTVRERRPATAEAGAWRALELGHLESTGSFKPLCNVLESRSFSDVAVAVDKAGSVWIVYTSADGTWVEQRGQS